MSWIRGVHGADPGVSGVHLDLEPICVAPCSTELPVGFYRLVGVQEGYDLPEGANKGVGIMREWVSRTAPLSRSDPSC